MADVLIAERDPILREMLEVAVARDGHTVEAVATGDVALLWLASAPFDCLLIGAPLMLNRHVRRTLLEYLEQSGSDVAPRVIVLTARVFDRELLVRAARLGVCAVFSEPFDLDELRRTIDRCSHDERPPRRFIGFSDLALSEIFGHDASAAEW